jgi:hypothetical protein
MMNEPQAHLEALQREAATLCAERARLLAGCRNCQGVGSVTVGIVVETGEPLSRPCEVCPELRAEVEGWFRPRWERIWEKATELRRACGAGEGADEAWAAVLRDASLEPSAVARAALAGSGDHDQ